MSHAYDFYKPNLASEYPVSFLVPLQFMSKHFLASFFWSKSVLCETV